MNARIPHRRQRQEHHKEGIQLAPPLTIKLFEQATVLESKCWLLVTGMGKIAQESKETTDQGKFLLDWQIKTEEIGNRSTLMEAIKTGKAVAVGNGLYYMEMIGTAAWTLEGPTDNDSILGIRYTPGMTDNQSTYCSKIFGLWGILFTILRFTKEYNITDGKVTIACNRLSVSNMCNTKDHLI